MSDPSATPSPRPRWLETFLSLEHDEARERRGVLCFVRPELAGCLTAEVSQSDGRWATRLFTSPHESVEITRSNRRAAERIAEEHSDSLTPETFFADGAQTPADVGPNTR